MATDLPLNNWAWAPENEGRIPDSAVLLAAILLGAGWHEQVISPAASTQMGRPLGRDFICCKPLGRLACEMPPDPKLPISLRLCVVSNFGNFWVLSDYRPIGPF